MIYSGSIFEKQFPQSFIREEIISRDSTQPHRTVRMFIC
jgi:hypothetical protein